jgi:phasin family protein
MTNVFEYFTAANQAGFEAAAKLAKSSFDKTEQLTQLGFEYGRAQFDDMLKQVPNAAELRDPATLVASGAKVAETNFTKATQFGREAYGIAVAHQAEVRKAVEDRVASLQKDAANFAEQAAKSVPANFAGNEFASTAFKNAMTAGSVFTDSFMRASKQATSFVDAAFKAQETAVESAVETAKSTVKTAAKRK